MNSNSTWLLLIVLCHVGLGDKTFYVDVNAVDTTNCGNSTAPCASIHAGVATACSYQTQTNESVTVIVGPGTYFNFQPCVINCSLSLISSDGPESTIIYPFSIIADSVPQGIVYIDGFAWNDIFRYAVRFANLQEIVLKNIYLQNTTADSSDSIMIFGINTTNVIIDNIQAQAVAQYDYIFLLNGTQSVEIANLIAIEVNAITFLYVEDTNEVYLDNWTVISVQVSSLMFVHADNIEFTNSFFTQIFSDTRTEEPILFFLYNYATISNFTLDGSGGFPSALNLAGIGTQIIGIHIVEIINLDNILVFSNNGVTNSDISISNCHFYDIAIPSLVILPSKSTVIVEDTIFEVISCTNIFTSLQTIMFGQSISMSNVTVTNNEIVTFLSMGFYSINSTVTVQNSTFTSNEVIGNFEVSDISVPAIFALNLNPHSILHISSSYFKNNSIGAVATSGDGLFHLEDCEFSDNVDTNTYIVRSGAQVIFNSLLFNDNAVKSDISFDHSANITITNTKIMNSRPNDCVMLATNSKIIASNLTISNITVGSETVSVIQLRSAHFFGDNISGTDNSAIYGGVFGCNGYSQIELTNSYFKLNSAKVGGVLFTTDYSTVNISNVTITDCFANLDGAGLFLSGSTGGVISDSIFENNTAQNDGGAVAIMGVANVTLQRITIHDNKALLGAGIFIGDHAEPQIVQCTLTNNLAKTGGGGGFITSYAKPVFENSTITHCVANSVGAAFNVQAFAKVTFTNLFIADNFSPNEGGGMYLEDSTNSTIVNVVFLRNTAGSSAGGVSLIVNSTAVFINCTFQNNIAGSKGGAIAVLNRAKPVFLNTNIENNTANTGGAFYATDMGVLNFINCNIIGNRGSSRAGAAYLSSASQILMIESLISKNIAESGPGGGILLEDSASAILQSSVISGNRATHGGGIHSVAYGNGVVATFCHFYNNTALYNGGGISMGEITKLLLIESTCRNNTASKGDGGCINMQDSAEATLQNTTFAFNSASTNGGACAALDSTFITASGTTYTNNTAYFGGALYISATTFYTESSSSAQKNYAAIGGAMFLNGNQIILSNVQYLNNSAGQIGGAVSIGYSNNSAPILTSCSFFGNVAPIGGALYLAPYVDVYSSISTDTAEKKDKMQQRQNVLSLQFESIRKEYETADIFSFSNISMSYNTAGSAGAIYFDSVSAATPRFGGGVELSNNGALSFGGAIGFGSYIVEHTLFYNASFVNNYAGWSGANAAWLYFSVDPYAFCENCSFVGQFGGYNNPYGFATPPNSLGFNDTFKPCPGNLYMGEDADIEIFLYDQFDTVCKGQFLQDNIFHVVLRNDTNEDVTTTATNTMLALQPDTGSAEYELSFCSPDNSTVGLNFESIAPINTNYVIKAASCIILLLGCNSGYEIEKQDTGCTICVASGISKLWIFSLSLLGLCFLLFSILVALLSSFVAYKYWKKRKRDKLQTLEIPDFAGRPSLTLDDILNDPSISRIPWEEIELGDTIGKGASGLVSKAIWTPSSSKPRDVALKELIFGFQDFGPEVLDDFLVEIKYMSALIDDNIVQFLGICVPPDGSKLYLVTELMHYGSLRSILDKKGDNLPMDIRVQVAKDAAKGMAYLHSKKLIHRDLKAENLLVNNEWKCKVADFGISTVKPTITRQMTCIGTPIYMAPEVLAKNKYSEKADVFSFGIVLYEIFTGKRPYSDGEFGQMNQAQLMFQIIEKEARPSLDNLDVALQQLIRDCWDLDPRLRPSFSETVVRLRRLKFDKKKRTRGKKENSEVQDSVDEYSSDRSSLTLSSDAFDGDFKNITSSGNRVLYNTTDSETARLLIN